MIRAFTLIDPSAEILPLKRSRLSFPIDELKGSKLYKKIPSLSVGELHSLSRKKWIILLTNLSEGLSSKRLPRNIEEVFCHVLKACGTKGDIEEEVIQFFEKVRTSGVFNPETPASSRLFELSLLLDTQKSFMAVRIANLGLLFNRVGLMAAAIDSNNPLFIKLLNQGCLFSSAQDDELVKMVVNRLNKESINLFIQKSDLILPKGILFCLLDNAHLKAQEKIDLIEMLLKRGASTLDLNYKNVDLISAALSLKLKQVAIYLLDKPLDTALISNFFQYAYRQDDLDLYKELESRFPDYSLIIPSKPTPEIALSFLKRLSVLTHICSYGYQWDGEKAQAYPPVLSVSPPKDQSVTLMKEAEVQYKRNDYILEQETCDLLIVAFRDDPQSILLSQLINLKDLNTTFFFYYLAKRVSHVWGIKLQVEEPYEKRVIDGESFDQYLSLLSFASFFLTRVYNSEPLVLFVREAFRNIVCYGDSDDIILNALSKKDHTPVLLTSGYNEHFTCVILYKDFLVFCDREQTQGFSIYKIDEYNHSIVNLELIDKILNDSVKKEESATEDFLKNRLNLTLIYKKNMKIMNGGFCTQGGTSAAFQALLTLGSKTDANSWDDANKESLGLYKQVKAAYRSLVAEEVLLSAKLILEHDKTDTEGDYFYKLLLAVFLKMSSHPDKLKAYSPESEHLKDHLIERMNAISEASHD